MTRVSWLLLLVICLTLAIATSEWVFGPGRVVSPDQGDAPDLLMQDAVITQYGSDGAASYELESIAIEHFEHENLTHLTAPHLELYRTEGPPLRLEAERGTVRHRSPTALEEEVYLEGDVRLEQRGQNESFVTLSTESLYVYPDRRYAATDQSVIIQTNSGRTKAVGLEALFDRGVFHLSSNAQQPVHTVVTPDQFKD